MYAGMCVYYCGEFWYPVHDPQIGGNHFVDFIPVTYAFGTSEHEQVPIACWNCPQDDIVYLL